MDGAHQHKLYPVFELHPQLLQHQSGNEPGLLESPDVSAATAVVPPRVPVINHRSSISYRQIRPSDLEVLQEIHEALFPIKYETEFFMNVIHGRGIISWAAVDTSRSDSHCDELIGFVTARVVTASECEELDMLGYEISSSERSLIYILTLGVIPPYRNSGIASALLWEVIEYANQMSSIKALYLHVIAYNHPAIMFYQKNMFQCIRRLPNFYFIEGQHHDAYLHVYYVNGGRSPCTAIYSLRTAFAHLRGFFTSMTAKLF
jgi:ribosomal protein S18 acetylase RimI-like enzyme